ncbi:MAG: hypothetical protein AABZ32_05005, partial [Bacteroidota bacterium]
VEEADKKLENIVKGKKDEASAPDEDEQLRSLQEEAEDEREREDAPAVDTGQYVDVSAEDESQSKDGKDKDSKENKDSAQVAPGAGPAQDEPDNAQDNVVDLTEDGDKSADPQSLDPKDLAKKLVSTAIIEAEEEMEKAGNEPVATTDVKKEKECRISQ